MALYYSQRVELAERFLARFLESMDNLFHEHWSSQWCMGERVAQKVCPLDGHLLVVAEFFIVTSPEMNVLADVSLGISSEGYSRLWYHWMPEDLHPRAIALRSILKFPEELSLEWRDDETLEEQLGIAVRFFQQRGPWIKERGTLESILHELASTGDIEALERSILLLAGAGEIGQALHRFDEVLWPKVIHAGERMMLERWRRLRGIIAELEEEVSGT
jgi:hypothetical protein